MKQILKLSTLLFFVCSFVYAETTQNNSSGSNTNISGGYTSSATNTYQSGSSSNTTTTNNSSSNIRSAPPSAFAPNLSPSGMDVCSVSASGGIQTFGMGLSAGKSFRDKNCERIKLARELKSNGMAVASVALLCQDARVFDRVKNPGTPRRATSHVQEYAFCGLRTLFTFPTRSSAPPRKFHPELLSGALSGPRSRDPRH